MVFLLRKVYLLNFVQNPNDLIAVNTIPRATTKRKENIQSSNTAVLFMYDNYFRVGRGIPRYCTGLPK